MFADRVKISEIKQDAFIEKNHGSIDTFTNEFTSGCFIDIPVDCIVPRSAIEFDNASPCGSKTDSAIELTYEKLGRDKESRMATLVVHDGHNRLKSLIARGVINVKCKIV